MQEENDQFCLLGYSGHALVVAEAALLGGLNLTGYAERKKAGSNPYNLVYFGSEASVDFEGWKESIQYINGIGDNKIRTHIAEYIRGKGGLIAKVVHPSANVSKLSKIGSGTFIARGASINPFVSIGKDVIVNTSASIDHECIIYDGVHIAPGSILCGNVEIGAGTFVGAGSVIKQGVKIGKGVVIGAGTVVIKDIEDNTKVVGNPAGIIPFK